MSTEVKRLVSTLRTSGPLWTASLVADRLLPYPVLRRWPDRPVSREALVAQVEAILRGWGMTEAHVALTAGHIVAADMRGVDSHGASMLLGYHRLLTAGLLSMTADVRVVSETPATAVIDGGGGLGHVPADTAMRLAIAKCRDTGLAAVAVRGSRHFGAAGVYAAMAAEEGLIGMVTTDTRSPAVLPAFGAEAALGTNPIAFAAPGAEGPPFELDMATTAASLGRVLGAWRRGRRVPRGWALAPSGRPRTDGRRAYEERRLLPLGSRPALGSYKGYGLAAMVEILSALLPGASEPGAAKGDVGHFFLAMDPARFRTDGGFASDVDRLSGVLRATRPLDPGRPVLVPGDPERAATAHRTRTGVPLSRSTFEDIRTVARASRVPFSLDGAP